MVQAVEEVPVPLPGEPVAVRLGEIRQVHRGREGQQAVRHRSGQEEQQKTGEQRREPRPLPLPQDAGEGEARALEQEELQL